MGGAHIAHMPPRAASPIRVGMTHERTTASWSPGAASEGASEPLALVLLFAHEEPERVGEVAFVPSSGMDATMSAMRNIFPLAG